jgi:rod shape-determining protein MreD
MALLTVCAGLEGGVEGGAWVGFFAGLLSDLFLVGTPLGLSALTLCLVGAAVGALRASVLHEGWALTPVLAFIGTAAAAIGFAFLGSLVGDMQLTASGGSWLMRVALIEGVWSALLSLPVSWLYRRAAAGSAGAERLGAALR